MKNTDGYNLKQLKLSHSDSVNTLLIRRKSKIQVNIEFLAVDPLLII